MNKLEEIIKSLGYVDENGKVNIAEFARFLGKKYSTVHKYIKNERNVGGGFVLDLKEKIPALNIEYFNDPLKPMFLDVAATMSNTDNVESEPLSGGNQQEYCAAWRPWMQ